MVAPRSSVANASICHPRRDGFAKAIVERGFRVAEGTANFLLLFVGPDATRLCDFVGKRGVLVRDRSSVPALRGMIRVTVGTEQENRAFVDCLDAFRQKQALIFDLDGTLVDTTRSFDATVLELVYELTGSPVEPGDLSALRGEGGYNDDWEASQELARRRGVEVQLERVAERGKKLYLTRARNVETQLQSSETLRRLAKRYRLFVLTGRSRDEYQPVWADRLDPLFERVYCHDDLPGLRKKPAPDMLEEILRRHQCLGGFYVGDMVDDVVAAKGAGLMTIAITGTVAREKLEILEPDIIVDDGHSVADVFGV
ncbi:MAG: hypothetical protein A2341_22765 [Deltaproteobacteria bacterium RIFOXYB12_FULL_58_9]|nr:MAG: hypothetical protein A2341_22765 [Deltaproteobacteria bacterium RIFOXYB12_FULL_58_9]